jgi:hypothetical protein
MIMGNAGNEFSYGDMGPMTTFCTAANAACLGGTMSPVNPPTYSYFGIGIGINLRMTVGADTPAPVQLSGTSVTIRLNKLPTSRAELIVTSGGMDYCALIPTATATIPWTSFNTKCYDSPPDGIALTGAPATPHIQVQVDSDAMEETVDFCIDTLSWQ